MTDFRQSLSAFFASRLGKKVSGRLKGSASLRIHCRWSTRSAVHKVFVLLVPNYASVLIECLSQSALNIISKSVMVYLHENDVSCKALAIDLCSRGFSVWQHYIDSMEMLRNLFNLATSTKKESISAQNVGPQARQALLHIVTHHTGIFMTALSLDILHPQSLEHRKSVMQLVAFLVRKVGFFFHPPIKLPDFLPSETSCYLPQSSQTGGSRGEVPGPYFHNEPRCRPRNSNRDSRTCRKNVGVAALGPSASELSDGFPPRSFPTVDFHMTSQRLAVGTDEGAIVMYDLKTATRLYVLECHKQALAACSFSPDGRRLVTASLEEGTVFVWKVGATFASFFNPGAPPRQGHGGSEPFKSLNFNVGDAGEFSPLALAASLFRLPLTGPSWSPLLAVMTLADTLEHIRFEWTAERSVQLRIRDVTLTFST